MHWCDTSRAENSGTGGPHPSPSDREEVMGPDGRRQIRLPDYDYTSQGWYFVTICIAGRRRLLASVRNDRLVPTAAGGIVERTWREMPDHFYGVRLDAFVVMPDHLHGIVVLEGDDDNAPPALSTVVGSFKSAA